MMQAHLALRGEYLRLLRLFCVAHIRLRQREKAETLELYPGAEGLSTSVHKSQLPPATFSFILHRLPASEKNGPG